MDAYTCRLAACHHGGSCIAPCRYYELGSKLGKLNLSKSKTALVKSFPRFHPGVVTI